MPPSSPNEFALGAGGVSCHQSPASTTGETRKRARPSSPQVRNLRQRTQHVEGSNIEFFVSFSSDVAEDYLLLALTKMSPDNAYFFDAAQHFVELNPPEGDDIHEHVESLLGRLVKAGLPDSQKEAAEAVLTQVCRKLWTTRLLTKVSSALTTDSRVEYALSHILKHAAFLEGRLTERDRTILCQDMMICVEAAVAGTKIPRPGLRQHSVDSSTQTEACRALPHSFEASRGIDRAAFEEAAREGRLARESGAFAPGEAHAGPELVHKIGPRSMEPSHPVIMPGLSKNTSAQTRSQTVAKAQVLPNSSQICFGGFEPIDTGCTQRMSVRLRRQNAQAQPLQATRSLKMLVSHNNQYSMFKWQYQGIGYVHEASVADRLLHSFTILTFLNAQSPLKLYKRAQSTEELHHVVASILNALMRPIKDKVFYEHFRVGNASHDLTNSGKLCGRIASTCGALKEGWLSESVLKQIEFALQPFILANELLYGPLLGAGKMAMIRTAAHLNANIHKDKKGLMIADYCGV